MKKIALALLVFVLFSSLALTIDKNEFLLDEQAKYQAELDAMIAAKDILERDQKRIDRISEELPNLETLIADCQDAELRGDWLELQEVWIAEVESWEADIAGWDKKITEAQDKVDEIDRLLAE